MAALPLPFNNFGWLALFASITLAKFQNKFTSKRGIEGQLSTRQKNWIVDSSPWNSDSRYWIPTEHLVSGTSDYWSQSSVAFRIPKFGIVRILGAKTPRIPDSAIQYFPMALILTRSSCSSHSPPPPPLLNFYLLFLKAFEKTSKNSHTFIEPISYINLRIRLVKVLEWNLD